MARDGGDAGTGRLRSAGGLGAALVVAAAVMPDAGAPSDSEGSPEYRGFFDAVPVAQLILDQARVIRLSNPAAQRLFQWSGDELEGRPFSELLPPTSFPAVDQAFGEANGAGSSAPVAVEGRAARGALLRLELVIVRFTSGGEVAYGAIVRELGGAAPGPAAPGAPGSYTLAELLLANRLRELV